MASSVGFRITVSLLILLPKLRGSDSYPGGTNSHRTRQPSLDAQRRLSGGPKSSTPYSSLYREQLYTKRSNTDFYTAVFHRRALSVRQQIPQSAAMLRDVQRIPRKLSGYLTWGEIHNQ